MSRPRKRPNTSTRVIAYLRVSTAEQAVSGLGLAAQRAAIESEATRRGWTDVHYIADEGHSAKSLRRPGITAALAELAAGRAGVLVAAKLDRLSRSTLDFADLMERGRAEGWTLLALDVPLDTSATPMGEAMASMVVTFAQLERRLIGQRTKAALAVLQAQGVRLGRPSTLAPEVLARIVAEYAAGVSQSAIARGLDADGVPTAQGGARWYPATVAKVLRSQDAEALTA